MLNRLVGPDTSWLQDHLRSNGRVFLINADDIAPAMGSVPRNRLDDFSV